MRQWARSLACSGCILLGACLQPPPVQRLRAPKPSSPGSVRPTISRGSELAAVDGGRSLAFIEPPHSHDVTSQNVGAGHGASGLQEAGLAGSAALSAGPLKSMGRPADSVLPDHLGTTFFIIYWGSMAAIVILFYLFGFNEVQEPVNEVSVEGDSYSLVLLAALKQVKLGYDEDFGIVGAVVFCIVACAIQTTLVVLLVGGINPYSKAVAEEPAEGWMTQGHVLAVSAMKWLMSFVLVLKVTAEIESSILTVQTSMEVEEDRLFCPRWVPISAGVLQYLSSLLIIYAGCAAVLSFQRTPDIVYSGLAVCFLTEIDNLLFTYFTVTIRRVTCTNKISLSESKDGDWRRSASYQYLHRCLGFLPLLGAVYVVGRAFLTGNTPIRILHRHGLTPTVTGQ